MMFKYPMSENKIVMDINIDNLIKQCWIVNYELDVTNKQLFIMLLKEAISSMKELGINQFIQMVTNDDWNNLLQDNKSWTILNEECINTKLIGCDIEEAPVCVAKGLGLI